MITNAYVVGNNSANSDVRVAILTDSPDDQILSYQWYRSSVYDGVFDKIPGATNGTYRITISDKYIKCSIVGTNNSIDTNVLVINQLDIVSKKEELQSTKLANIGRGLSFEQLISNVSGASNIVSDITRINQSIKIILSTARGEVPMLPNIGTDIPKMIFNGATESNIEQIRLEAETSIADQEPRISLSDVTAEYDDDHTIYIKVDYKVKNTNIQSQYIYKVDTGVDYGGGVL